MRFVFDTNVLIDGFADNFNAQARLIDAVRDGEIEAIVTDHTTREYQRILHRLINDDRYKSRIKDFLSMTTKVVPSAPLENLVIDDQEDEKFLRAARGGKADAIVTNDHHLLDLGEIGNIRIVRPTEAWTMVEEGSSGKSAWEDFIRGIGITR